MKKYELNFLTDKEFDTLGIVNPRYQTEDTLGMADMRTNRIFIRKTNIPFVDQFVTEHEIEEILSLHSDHELDGVRYKKGGIARFLVPIGLGILSGGLGLPALAGTAISGVAGAGMGAYAGERHPEELGGAGMGALTGGLTGALSGYGGSALGAGAVKGATAAAPGFLSKAGGIATGAIKGLGSALGFGGKATPTTGGTTGQNWLAQMPTATAEQATMARPLTGTTFGSYAGSSLPSAGLGFSLGRLTGQPNYSPIAANQGGVNPATSTGTTTSNVDLGKINVSQQAPGTAGTAPSSNLGFGGLQQTAKTKPTLWEKLFPKEGYSWGKTALGAAIPLVGSAFGNQEQTFSPEQSQMFNDITARVQQGNMLKLTPEQSTAITATYDKQLENAREALVRRYKAVRPGSDITNDTEMKQAVIDLENDYAIQKANAITGAEMGLTADQTSMMSQLAAMDIYSLAQAAQISVEEANSFKEMLSNIGIMVATSGEDSPYAGLSKIFQ